jgi:molybdopterin molybdotransferase
MQDGLDSSSISRVLSFEDARSVVEEHAVMIPPPATESIELLASAGRVLAEKVLADRDIPPFPRSTRDGYGVRSADLAKLPAALDVIGEIKAGERPDNIPAKVGSGETVSIMTGAPVPDGADAVVMVEYTSRHADRIEISRTTTPGENIVPRGAEAKNGSCLLDRGTRLNEAAIALAASVGKLRLHVYQKPKIAVLSTGDEIVPVDASPVSTQIRNSNSYSLAAQILRAGGQPILLPIAPDEPQRLRELIEEGLQSDLLLMTGGVSMGRYDLVEQVLSDLQAQFFFTGAKIQPGKPVVFGRCRSIAGAGTPFDKLRAGSAREGAARNSGAGAHTREKASEESTYFFGLPGNPVSTMVTFELFARPMVEALSGQLPQKLAFLHAKLKSEIRVKLGLRRFLPATLSGEFEHSEVELVLWKGSGDIAATARANCYIVVPPDRERIPAGEWVALLLR